jgi:hypothetical protein
MTWRIVEPPRKWVPADPTFVASARGLGRRLDASATWNRDAAELQVFSTG